MAKHVRGAANFCFYRQLKCTEFRRETGFEVEKAEKDAEILKCFTFTETLSFVMTS